MPAQRLIRNTSAAALAASLVLIGTLPAMAVQSDDDYPTWAEVEAARGSEKTTKAEYERLQKALSQTQAAATEASSSAAEASAAAQAAEQDLQTATWREEELQRRVDQAQKDLTQNDEALGRMVSWLYTNGTGLASTDQLIGSEDPEDFMAKLSTATQVSGTWRTMTDRAAAEVNTASSLEEQAEAAKTERDQLAKKSEEAAAAAEAAEQRAEAAVSDAGERSDTVYKQLASLRGTTADVERRYQVGLQVAEQAREQERQREIAAQQQQEDEAAGVGGGTDGGTTGGGTDGGTTGGGSGGDTGGTTGGGGGVSVDPAGAQAHARAVLGGYGWADDQYGCLVSLWNGESGWRADALNPSSGAYGIPQSLPAEKMAAAGADWLTNGNTQVDWGLAYIQAAYGSPCNAWNTWQSRNPHWY